MKLTFVVSLVTNTITRRVIERLSISLQSLSPSCFEGSSFFHEGSDTSNTIIKSWVKMSALKMAHSVQYTLKKAERRLWLGIWAQDWYSVNHKPFKHICSQWGCFVLKTACAHFRVSMTGLLLMDDVDFDLKGHDEVLVSADDNLLQYLYFGISTEYQSIIQPLLIMQS